MYQWFLVPSHWSGSLAECISKWYNCSLTLVSKKMYQENCWYHCSPTLVSWQMYQQHILILLQKLWKLWQELLLKNEQQYRYFWSKNGCLWRIFCFSKAFGRSESVQLECWTVSWVEKWYQSWKKHGNYKNWWFGHMTNSNWDSMKKTGSSGAT